MCFDSTNLALGCAIIGFKVSLTYLTVKVTGEKNKSFERRFLIDSGATYSVVPAKILKKLGVQPIDKQTFILGNGETIEKEIGEAKFEVSGKVRTAPVIFGDEGVFLLGATTLENLGMILDPINRELKQLPMVI